MKKIKIISDPRVKSVFENYPDSVKEKILNLRRIILETAEESEEIIELTETLKWGEPSYLNKIGSTVRIDWKPKHPNQYAMYFSCSTRLVETFKLIFPSVFSFEGKRAIVFNLDDRINEPALKQCIAAALRYKKVKHLPTLGI